MRKQIPRSDSAENKNSDIRKNRGNRARKFRKVRIARPRACAGFFFEVFEVIRRRATARSRGRLGFSSFTGRFPSPLVHHRHVREALQTLPVPPEAAFLIGMR